MALATEALKSRHGILLYSVQVSKGTPVTPATSAGILSADFTSDDDLRSIFGVGSANALFLKDGFNQVPFSINVTHLQSKAFLQQAVRASGALPWLTLGFGYRDDAGTVYLWQVQDCKLHTADLACDAGGPATLSVTGVGGLITELSAGAAANLTPTPFLSYEGVLTKAGSAYESQSIRVSVNHNVDVKHVLHGAAPTTFKRGWKHQIEGAEVITGEISRFQKSGVNLQADVVSEISSIAFALTDIAGGGTPNAATVTLNNVKFGSERIAESDDPSADITFVTPFVSRTWAVS